MRLLEWARRNVFVVAALVGALAGVVVGLFLPIRAAQPAKGEALEWKLPPATAVRRFNEENFAVVLGANYLGATAEPARRGASAAGWALTAILTSPRVLAAVTAQGSNAGTRWIQLGGELPDGATLLAANRDTIWFEKDGCRRKRTLHRAANAGDQACIGATTTEAATSQPSTPTVPAPTVPGAGAAPAASAAPARPSSAAARNPT